jgi:hypothetical protein
MVFTTTSSSLAPDKMQLRAILNRVEKQKGFVYRNARFANDGSEILVDIHPHGRSRPVCSKCGRKGPQYDTLSERRFEFVPLWAIAVFFWDAPIFCTTRYERLGWEKSNDSWESQCSFRYGRCPPGISTAWPLRSSCHRTAIASGSAWLH